MDHDQLVKDVVASNQMVANLEMAGEHWDQQLKKDAGEIETDQLVIQMASVTQRVRRLEMGVQCAEHDKETTERTDKQLRKDFVHRKMTHSPSSQNT